MFKQLLHKRRKEKQLLQSALRLKANRQFSEAIKQLELALALNPKNSSTKVLMSRVEILSKL